jgi:large subunit ribosomal protein L29
MEIEKIVNLDDRELVLQANQAAEQIFRLRFQLAMGQQEGVKKYRELRKDVARIKTVQRQRQLGIQPAAGSAEAKPKSKSAKPKAKTAKAKTAKGGSSRSSAKKTARPAKAKKASTVAKTVKRGTANAKKGGS